MACCTPLPHGKFPPAVPCWTHSNALFTVLLLCSAGTPTSSGAASATSAASRGRSTRRWWAASLARRARCSQACSPNPATGCVQPPAWACPWQHQALWLTTQAASPAPPQLRSMPYAITAWRYCAGCALPAYGSERSFPLLLGVAAAGVVPSRCSGPLCVLRAPGPACLPLPTGSGRGASGR
jgi:hypothetical protein